MCHECVKPLCHGYSWQRSLGSGRDLGAMEAARRVCRVSANKKPRPTSIQLERHRRTASQSGRPRAAQSANERHGASDRRRKSISRAKTAGARRPVGGERSTSNILFSLDPRTYRETRCHAGSVIGTTSNDYATTTTSSRAGRTRRREVGPGDWRAHRRRQERFHVERPWYGDTLYDGDGMAASYRRPPSKTRRPSVYHGSNDRPTKIQVNQYTNLEAVTYMSLPGYSDNLSKHGS